MLNIPHSHTQIHSQTNFQKLIFFNLGNLKTYKSDENSISKILTEHKILLLPNGSRIMEVKIISFTRILKCVMSILNL